MFTGIVDHQATVVSHSVKGAGIQLRLQSAFQSIRLGESISVNGVCLTVVAEDHGLLIFDISPETLSLTNLGGLVVDAHVNVERAVAAQDLMGGHWVSGHVDGLGTVVALSRDARSWRVSIEAPADLARYIASKGSICVDGTSLTVNSVSGARFELNIIPQTWEETVFSEYGVGTEVNLEVDIIARYLERLLQSGVVPSSDGITLDTLKKAGYHND